MEKHVVLALFGVLVTAMSTTVHADPAPERLRQEIMQIQAAEQRADGEEEIPRGEHDKLIPKTGPASSDRRSYYVKAVKCDGEVYGLLYLSMLGYSKGTKFIGVCSPQFADNVDACKSDSSLGARKCYNKALKKFNLEGRYKLADVSEGPVNLDQSEPVIPPPRARTAN